MARLKSSALEKMQPVDPTLRPPEVPPAPQQPVAAPAKTLLGRSELLDAGKILSEIMMLQPGQLIGDLGAGGGLFATQAARLVGEQGQVYAVDVVKNVLSEIESKCRMAGLHNIKTIWSNLEIVGATKIREATLDAAILVNIMHQSQKHYEIMAEASRLLKPGGKLLIIDWDDQAPKFAPPDHMKVNKTKLTEYAGQLGMGLEREFKAGTYHFGLIYIRQ